MPTLGGPRRTPQAATTNPAYKGTGRASRKTINRAGGRVNRATIGTPGPRNPFAGVFGGGGGSAGGGARGGGSRGGAPPPGAFAGGSGAGYTSRVDPNPYLDKVFSRFEGLFDQSQDLYGKALDPSAAMENYKDLRAQGLREAQAQAGNRGFGPGTGMSLAQTQDILNRSQQGEHELAADWQNRAMEFQKSLLGTMGNVLGGAAGVGAGIGQEQLGWGNQGLAAQRQLTDAWYKSQMLPIEMEKAKTANLSNQIAAIRGLAGLWNGGLF